MIGVSLKTLQDRLRDLNNKDGQTPEDNLDELRAWASIHYQLYGEEKDSEGVAIYQPILDEVMKAKSVDELKKKFL